MTTVIKPVLHRVLVRPLELDVYDETYERAKASNIIIAQTEDNKYIRNQVDQGIVVAIGPTAFLDYVVRYNQDIPVRVGDLVTYVRHAGKWIDDPDNKDKQLMLLQDEDVICVVQEQE